MSIAESIDAAAPARPRELRGEPIPPRPTDHDLSCNVAGAHARAHASRLRAQAPVRTAIARAFGIKTAERSSRIDAEGEEGVAAELAKLGPAWRILHSIPLARRGGDISIVGRGGDIDHLAIGPAGVFAINTQNHPDANIWVNGETFKLNGVNQHYVRNSRHAAAYCGKVLTAHTGIRVDARAVIAVMGAGHGFIIKAQPTDAVVRVVSRRALTRELTELPWVLDAPRIHAVYEAARRLSTWQSAPDQWTTASLESAPAS